MKYGPKEGDLTKKELLSKMETILSKDRSAKLYVKWTCPACGERVTCTQPNIVYEEMRHEEKNDGSPCGFIYRGPYYGLMAMFSRQDPSLAKKGEA